MCVTSKGQSCTAASRIYVHESIHDKFVAALTEKINALKALASPSRHITPHQHSNKMPISNCMCVCVRRWVIRWTRRPTLAR
jgi:hypothetical protein